MIFVDNEHKKLPDALVKELKQKLKNGILIKFPDKYLTTATDEKGRKKPQYPAAKTIPLVDSVLLNLDTMRYDKKDGQMVQVRYAQSFQKDKNGNPLYKPGSVIMSGTMVLNQEDYELYWFISECSRHVENSLNADANKTKHYAAVIYRPEEVFTQKVNNQKWEFKAISLIYDDEKEGGLSEKEIRYLATVFGVPSTDSMHINEVRVKLAGSVQNDQAKAFVTGDHEEKGYKLFLDLVNRRVNLDVRSDIQKAIDAGIIGYEPGRKAWYYLSEKKSNGDPQIGIEKIVSCEPATNRELVLVKYFEKEPEKYDHLKKKLQKDVPVVKATRKLTDIKKEINAARVAGDIDVLKSLLKEALEQQYNEAFEKELSMLESM